MYYNFIAQEYRDVFPESVKGSGEYLDSDQKELLQMDSYNAQIVAIKAVQELILQNREQQQIIEDLKEQVTELQTEKSELALLKEQIKALQESVMLVTEK